MIAHDFSTRLTQFDRWRRQTYTRGFVHGVVISIVGVLFVAWYLSVGSAS